MNYELSLWLRSSHYELLTMKSNHRILNLKRKVEEGAKRGLNPNPEVGLSDGGPVPQKVSES